MRKTRIGLVAMAICLAVPSVCMAALPPVTLNAPADCATYGSLTSEGEGLLSLLGSFITGLPTYQTAALENSNTGDGIPDHYKLAVLAALVCHGEPTVSTQFAVNKYIINNDLLAPLFQAVAILFGPTGHPEQGLIQEATQLSADLKVWAVAPVDPNLITAALTIASYLDSALASINSTVPPSTQQLIASYIPLVESLIPGYVDVAAGLIGLDTEMGTIITTYVTPSVITSITTLTGKIRTEVVPAIQAFIAAGGPSGLNQLTPSLITELTTVSNTLYVPGPPESGAAILIDRFAAFAANPGFEIYGVGAKTASEPLSALGSYAGYMDKNGNPINNLQVYQDLLNVGALANANTADSVYVAAVSGANPFYPGRSSAEGMPVAGVIGMAFLAGIVALGGALSIRKK